MTDYEKTKWNETLDDYLDLYLDAKGLDIDPEELENYPEEKIPNETEFFILKGKLDREIEELLG